jgi:putative hydrolase of the HAD superfamily
MPKVACLLDAYDTIVSYKPTGELPALAGVTVGAWRAGYRQVEQALNAGRISQAEGFGRILRACGVEPRPGLVRELVDRSRELLLTSARLYDDVIPFISVLRSRGIGVAIVSNCTEPTRELMGKLGVTGLADALVLSCEAGDVKPSARIFAEALGRLGVSAGAAVFVDDHPAYCAGAAGLGIAAVQITRGEPDGKAPVPGIPVVRSLPEVQAMFWDSPPGGADQGVEQAG